MAIGNSSLLPPPSIAPLTAEIDPPLHVFGFQIDVLSPSEVAGHLRVTDICCQPFKKLHGGVSALIAEALASMGAVVASGFRRVAGVQLSINHLGSAAAGDLVLARAVPLKSGEVIQIWEVCLWVMNQTTMEKETLISSSKVSIFCNMSVPENAKRDIISFKKYAKL
ncbi:hypothetical protein AXF42_Ash010932 [Apostasia shenzhenica]|uniref:Thioesterase domain-containing protein n=1 Tax=Apostasia shenzhenica TaxID=1088818 RepID=A0A2H9ZQM2_9ASPA|nr:hypothetical protein AXF42_Ash010932 [Apostasia shenzhenica]